MNEITQKLNLIETNQIPKYGNFVLIWSNDNGIWSGTYKMVGEKSFQYCSRSCQWVEEDLPTIKSDSPNSSFKIFKEDNTIKSIKGGQTFLYKKTNAKFLLACYYNSTTLKKFNLVAKCDGSVWGSFLTKEEMLKELNKYEFVLIED